MPGSCPQCLSDSFGFIEGGFDVTEQPVQGIRRERTRYLPQDRQRRACQQVSEDPCGPRSTKNESLAATGIEPRADVVDQGCVPRLG